MRGVAGVAVRRFWVSGLGRYMFAHPRDIPCVIRAGWRLRRREWWQHRPWLPFPAADYWEFRLTTFMGADGEMKPVDVIAVAKWSDLQDVRR